MLFKQYRSLALIIFAVIMIAFYLIYTNSNWIYRVIYKKPSDTYQSTVADDKAALAVIAEVIDNSTISVIVKSDYGTNDSVIEEFLPVVPNLLSIKFDRDDYYTFDMNVCPNSGANITVMILVTSAPEHKQKRDHVRKTWGHYALRSDIGFAFVIGNVLNELWENDLRYENMLYNDIILMNFFDSYDNLTLKSVSSLNWIDTFCNQTRFYLKCDDDVFINVPKLLDFIKLKTEVQRTIFGRLAVNWRPFRGKESKYYISEADYAPKYFVPFTTGPAYLMTVDCVHDLFTHSLVNRPLRLEDVYITGIVANGLNITRVNVPEFPNDNSLAYGLNATGQRSIAKHDLSARQQFDLWTILEL